VIGFIDVVVARKVDPATQRALERLEPVAAA
jgi:hypothetical protein